MVPEAMSALNLAASLFRLAAEHAGVLSGTTAKDPEPLKARGLVLYAAVVCPWTAQNQGRHMSPASNARLMPEADSPGATQ